MYIFYYEYLCIYFIIYIYVYILYEYLCLYFIKYIYIYILLSIFMYIFYSFRTFKKTSTDSLRVRISCI